MTKDSKVIAIELREDDMVVILIGALTHRIPPKDATAEQALADVDPQFVADCRRAVTALMGYWRDKVEAKTGRKTAGEVGLGGSLQ